MTAGGLLRVAISAASLVLLTGGAVATASTFQWFTTGSSFNAALDLGSYTATGAELASPGGLLAANPKTLSGGTYGFQVFASGGLYGVTGVGINPLNPPELTFQAFTPSQGVTAFGGLFSLFNNLDQRAGGDLSLTLYTGTAGTTLISSTTTTVGPASTFLGLVTYGGTQPITRVTLAATGSSASLLPTAEQVTVGVPEPSAMVGLTAGLVLVAVAFRVRSRLAKAACVLVAAAAFSVPAQAALAAMAVVEPPPRPASGAGEG